MKFSTLGERNRLSIFKSDGKSDTVECRVDSETCQLLSAGRYLIGVVNVDSMAVGTRLGFRIESRGRPMWLDYIKRDSSVCGKNYVRSMAMMDSMASQAIETVAYYDGLGRLSQTVALGASTAGSSLLSYTDYDLAGRTRRQFLPLPVESVDYQLPPRLDYTSEYAGDIRPFSVSFYDGTPLDRVALQFGPGQDWQKNGRATAFRFMLEGDDVALPPVWCFTATEETAGAEPAFTVRNTGPYGKGELTLTETVDEDGRRSVEYADAEGRPVLNRFDVGDGSYADTYYIYDDRGNAAVILQPEGSQQMSQTGSWDSASSEALREFAYLYSYDAWRRPVWKKLPGCEPTVCRYDSADNLYLWQDGNMRAKGLWRFDLADVFGRQCVSGICSGMTFDEGSRGIAMVKRIDEGDGALMGYTLEGAALQDPVVLTATYYDDYSFLRKYGFPGGSELDFIRQPDFADSISAVRGLPTGYASALPADVGSDSLRYTFSAVYYDRYQRPLQTVATNHLGGIDRASTAYDFSGKTILTEQHHTSQWLAEEGITLRRRMTYDNVGRPLTTEMRYGPEGTWTCISDRSYDRLGRLSRERRGVYASPDMAYGYDIRSRLTSLTSYHYKQTLRYTPGGNISRMDWWAFSPEGATRSYVYSYDGLCRLTAADYDDDRGGRGRFSTSYAYDLNGNVTSLLRYGRYSDTQYAPIDDLTLEYTGNRLMRATDSATGPYFQGALHFADNADEETEYAYDANGNTIADLNRGVLSATYDFNGMPRAIAFDDGSANVYVYDATGRKRRTVHRVASAPPSVPGAEPSGFVTMTADYCGDMLYEDSTLTRIDFEGGYLSFSDTYGNALAVPEYHFYVCDHLGNNRMDLTDGGAITQIVDYYPFGLPMGCSYRPAAQRRLFGGKELDRTSGLNLYDQEARLYDPATGRFTRPDPLSHDYTSVSHYSFCLNNPLTHTDPSGLVVTAVTAEAKTAILLTLSSEDRNHIKFMKDGSIDPSSFTFHLSQSKNFNNLSVLVNSSDNIIVDWDDKFEFKDNEGQNHVSELGPIEYDRLFVDDNPKAPTGPTTGETGFFGKTLLPGKGESGHNSVDSNIKIVINKGLSPLGAAQSFSHEGYGHALMYVKTHDRKASAHNFIGVKDLNRNLIKSICDSILETIKNNTK